MQGLHTILPPLRYAQYPELHNFQTEGLQESGRLLEIWAEGELCFGLWAEGYEDTPAQRYRVIHVQDWDYNAQQGPEAFKTLMQRENKRTQDWYLGTMYHVQPNTRSALTTITSGPEKTTFELQSPPPCEHIEIDDNGYCPDCDRYIEDIHEHDWNTNGYCNECDEYNVEYDEGGAQR